MWGSLGLLGDIWQYLLAQLEEGGATVTYQWVGTGMPLTSYNVQDSTSQQKNVGPQMPLVPKQRDLALKPQSGSSEKANSFPLGSLVLAQESLCQSLSQ